MEKLKDIEQLKTNKRFIIIAGETALQYDFICIHPYNDSYIIAIDMFGEPVRLYIPNLLDESTSQQIYVGDWDEEFIVHCYETYAMDRFIHWHDLGKRLAQKKKKSTFQ